MANLPFRELAYFRFLAIQNELNGEWRNSEIGEISSRKGCPKIAKHCEILFRYKKNLFRGITKVKHTKFKIHTSPLIKTLLKCSII